MDRPAPFERLGQAEKESLENHKDNGAKALGRVCERAIRNAYEIRSIIKEAKASFVFAPVVEGSSPDSSQKSCHKIIS